MELINLLLCDCSICRDLLISASLAVDTPGMADYELSEAFSSYIDTQTAEKRPRIRELEVHIHKDERAERDNFKEISAVAFEHSPDDDTDDADLLDDDHTESFDDAAEREFNAGN